VKAVDITAQRFGRLVCLSKDSCDVNGNGLKWLCQCDCGKQAVVASRLLRTGKVQSCGCLGKENQKHLVHGQSRKGERTGAYTSWEAMKRRVLNPNAINYDRYGGRGIRICERWMSFENFYADMGDRPDGMTLDRYPDVDGNYEPSNCRWATATQQSNNQRKHKANADSL
jgi:hypothetical protein